jgi:hypothetical protein
MVIGRKEKAVIQEVCSALPVYTPQKRKPRDTTDEPQSGALK